jgi:hypothetical protein
MPPCWLESLDAPLNVTGPENILQPPLFREMEPISHLNIGAFGKTLKSVAPNMVHPYARILKDQDRWIRSDQGIRPCLLLRSFSF